MDINTQNVNREHLNQEIENAEKLAAELKRELKESSQTRNLSLQNFYDAAADEKDLKTKIHLHQFVTARLQTLRKSLQLMNTGSYGICCGCGCEINERRLAAVPEATTCISCKCDGERIAQTEKTSLLSTPSLMKTIFLRHAA